MIIKQQDKNSLENKDGQIPHCSLSLCHVSTLPYEYLVLLHNTKRLSQSSFWKYSYGPDII